MKLRIPGYVSWRAQWNPTPETKINYGLDMQCNIILGFAHSSQSSVKQPSVSVGLALEEYKEEDIVQQVGKETTIQPF